MISANLSNRERRAIYKRDGYRCALCDSTRYLQIHHHVPRGEGGTDSPHNLITLCSDCHALAHGIDLQDWKDVTQEDIQQGCTEYLADFYAPGWNPWASNPRPCEQCHRRTWCQWPQTHDEDCPEEAYKPRKRRYLKGVCDGCGHEHNCKTLGCALERGKAEPP